MDFKNLGAKRVCIVTDKNVAQLNAMKQAVEGLSKEGIEFTVYDKVRVEPKDYSYVFALLSRFLMASLIVADWVRYWGLESRMLLRLPNHIMLTLSLPWVCYNIWFSFPLGVKSLTLIVYRRRVGH